MRTFLITARTATGTDQFTHFAESSGRAAEDVAAMYDEPCSITVFPGAH
jgi:hypothetical protein